MPCNGQCSQCQSGCEKHELRQPNVTGAIVGQFIRDAANRMQAFRQKKITEEEFDAMEKQTINWLATTFSGANPQFTCDQDWHPAGLARNLRLRIGAALAEVSGGKVPDDDRYVMYNTFAVFMAETYHVLDELERKGIEPMNEESAAPELLLHLKKWTEFLVGWELQYRNPEDEGDSAPGTPNQA